MNAAAETVEKKAGLRPAIVLLMLMGFACTVRVLAALSHPMIEMDETSYVRMAQNLVAGHGPLEITGLNSTNFSPLFPLLVAGFTFIARDYVVAAYVVSIAFGSLLLLPVYLLGKDLGGSRTGLLAAALVAVMPIYVDYSARLCSENVYVFFLLMSIVFARHMLQGCRIPCSTLAGSALGLAFLANPSAIFYLGAYLVLAAGAALRKGIVPQMSRAALVLVSFFLLYAGPYLVFLHAEQGRWTYQGKVAGNGYAASLGLRHNTVEWEREMLALDGDGGSIRLYQVQDSADPISNFVSGPGRALRNLVRQADYFYTQEMWRVLPLWLLPVMGLGLFATGWTRRRTAGIGYLLAMMLPALMIFTVYNVYTRLFMPFVALVLVWVAQGWERLEEFIDNLVDIWSARSGWRQPLRWLLAAAVILPLLAFSAATVMAHDYATGYRKAGESLAAPAGRDTKIMSRETAAAFYAGGSLVLLPYADYGAITAYARSNGVDYLTISRNDIENWRPGLTPLTQGPDRHPDWLLVDTVAAGTIQETFVFKLVK